MTEQELNNKQYALLNEIDTIIDSFRIDDAALEKVIFALLRRKEIILNEEGLKDLEYAVSMACENASLLFEYIDDCGEGITKAVKNRLKDYVRNIAEFMQDAQAHIKTIKDM